MSWASRCRLGIALSIVLLVAGCRTIVLVASPPPMPVMPVEAAAEYERSCLDCPHMDLWIRELARYDCAIAKLRGESDPLFCDEP